MTVKDTIISYLTRVKPNLSSKELSRVLSLNYNTTRKIVGELKRKKIITKGVKQKGLLRFEVIEKAEDFVKKYLSSVLYCAGANASHRNRKNAYAYTFELYALKDIDRSDDLYEEIKKFSKNCYEIDIDDVDQFGKNFGYGVEPRKIIEKEYVYPNIAVRIDGVKVQ
jgi:DNA-binding transcriptional regulator YhcF (GntR family)